MFFQISFLSWLIHPRPLHHLAFLEEDFFKEVCGFFRRPFVNLSPQRGPNFSCLPRSAQPLGHRSPLLDGPLRCTLLRGSFCSSHDDSALSDAVAQYALSVPHIALRGQLLELFLAFAPKARSLKAFYEVLVLPFEGRLCPQKG